MNQGTGAAILAACAALVTSCGRVEIQTSPNSSHAAPAADVAPSDIPALAPPNAPEWNPDATARQTGGVYVLPGMECLVNDHGIRVKVLVTDPGVRCLDRVPGGVLTGSQLKHFHPYFVFDRFPADGAAEHYLVGSTPRRDSVVGWAPASAVTRWDTRVGARYARREGVLVPPLLVYPDADHLVEILEQGATSQEPMARATLSAEQTLMPWPVAESRLVTVNGQVHELLRINFLGEFVEGADLGTQDIADIEAPEVYTEAQVASFQRDVRQLDIVFCVDNTHSTGDFIEGIRQAVTHISLELGTMSFQPDVRFGLCMYRDYVDDVMYREGDGYSVVQHHGMDTNLDTFLRRVRPIREADASSIDWAEAGYDGLHAALTRTPWRGNLAAKCVVLIGDNSFHEPDSDKNPHNIGLGEISQLAEARDVKIFSLCIDGKGGEEEQAIHWNQFEAISRSTGASCFKLEESGRVVDSIRSIMDDETAIVHTRALVLDDLIDGSSSDQIVADHDLDLREVTEVMEFLSGAGIDVGMLGPGVPSFATGWILAEYNGVQLVDHEVYVARAELDVLLASMNMLCTHLSPDFGMQALSVGAYGRENPLSAFFTGEVPEPLDVFLMAKGIPVGSSSVLRKSAEDLRFMPEETRAALRERISRQNVPMLVNARNDDSLWTYRDELEFGWISERALP